MGPMATASALRLGTGSACARGLLDLLPWPVDVPVVTPAPAASLASSGTSTLSAAAHSVRASVCASDLPSA
jgi:hypothetical protein